MIDRNLTAQQEKLKSLNEKISRIVDSVQTKVEWKCKEEPVSPILTCRALLQGLNTEIPKLCFFNQRKQENPISAKILWNIFFYEMASGGLYSLIYITTHSPSNYLCAVDTTLRLLITWYKLHVMKRVA